jgi:hypothetical protein
LLRCRHLLLLLFLLLDLLHFLYLLLFVAKPWVPCGGCPLPCC